MIANTDYRLATALQMLSEAEHELATLLGRDRTQLWLDKITNAAIGNGPRGDRGLDVLHAVEQMILDAAEQPREFIPRAQ